MKEYKEKIYTGRGTILQVKVMAIESIVQRYSPENVFHDLQLIEDFIIDQVSEHQGLFSGNLKNGMTCFFGWQGQSGKDSSQAVEAFRCAESIQQMSAAALSQDPNHKHPIFPLQISMTTDSFSVCVCEKSADESRPIRHNGIIGAGVDLAQGIVDYCGIKSILISTDTKKLIEQADSKLLKPNEIRIKLKGRSKIITAYEHNTLQSREDVYQLVTNRVQNSIDRRLDDQRLPCQESIIDMFINDHSYILLNISRGGIEIEGEVPHVHGEIVRINLSRKGDYLRDYAEKLGLSDIECEVRWNRKSTNKYNLGLMFTQLNGAQREELLSLVISQVEGKAII